ncbi:FCD domain-containing protein [Rhodomicrobium sp. Az07]|uniref:FCD domain-containing protein n=1 Tax=Rhodomicrobium sp. Az07 TaxID=2839034 RepID=UPI001BED38A5|nr:FCD domain-containing protein [Rhodomicrobium sp. Az07]MBT3070315.1 FCD domain-containing protein [Rhodomicrobium sp. Az07]
MADAKPSPALRVSECAEAMIETFIEDHGLRPGDRLPSERALAEMAGVSRASLREAVGRMAARKRVTVRKSGIVVAGPPVAAPAAAWAKDTISTPLAPLVAFNSGYSHDVLEIRQALEGTAAYFAALRADADDKARIREAFEAMRESHGAGAPMEEARKDAAFHLAIAEASHNAVLRQVMSSMFGLLQVSISQSLEKLYTVPQTFDALSQQHRALIETIEAGDAERARQVSDRHLRFVESTIKRIDDDLARKARSSAARSTALQDKG